MDIEITHGPILFVEGAGFGMFHARGQVDLPTADTHGPGGAEVSEPHYALLNVRFFTRGKVDSRLEVPLLVRETLGAVLRLDDLLLDTNWSGASAVENLYLAVKRFELHRNAPGPGLSVALSQLRIDMEFPQGMASGALLPPVTTNTSLGELVFSITHDNPELRMTGLTARESTTREADGALSGQSDTIMKSLSILGREFAPMVLQAEFGGLDEAGLTEFLAAASASAERPPASNSDARATPPTAASPGREATNRALYGLLAGNPFFDLKVDAKFRGKDEVKLDMRLGIDGTRAPAGNALENAGYPLDLLAGLECSLSLSFPVAAANELLSADLVPMLMLQGVLKQDESTYLVRADIRDGMLILNGQPIPLDQVKRGSGMENRTYSNGPRFPVNPGGRSEGRSGENC